MSDAAKDNAAPAPANNFIRNIIEADLAAGKHALRRWAVARRKDFSGAN